MFTSNSLMMLLSAVLIGLLKLSDLIHSTIVIEMPNRTKFYWQGCLYRRVDILHDPHGGDNCTLCTVSGTENASFSIPPKESYRNCTTECKKPTLCTYYTYNLLSKSRPECFQCEQWTGENVFFRSIRFHMICTDECKNCAKSVDLATASHCAAVCGGLPTFCYPKRMYFGHMLCLQANCTYGCTYRARKQSTIPTGPNGWTCATCARIATQDTAQQCAIDCDGVPTYLTFEDKARKKSKDFMQCTLGSYQDVFQHEIPKEVLIYIRESHPLAAKNLTVHPHFR